MFIQTLDSCSHYKSGAYQKWEPAWLVLTEKSMEFSSWKRFYYVVSSIICCPKEARASIVLHEYWMSAILSCNRLSKKEQNKSVRGLFRKTPAPHSTVNYLRCAV